MLAIDLSKIAVCSVIKQLHISRSFSTRISRVALVHHAHGNPEEVVSLDTADVPNMESSDVLVKLLKAPVNPADINKIQGTYPEKSLLPAVCGNEGVGRVVEVGSSNCDLKPGDLVIPALAGIGTWQNYGVYPASAWMRVPSNLPLSNAASLLVNPCTAYRMLTDFVLLKDGDVIIQNAANSAVGQSVIQLASINNIKTINVIRERPNFEQISKYLMELGGSVVISEEYLASHNTAGILNEYGTPRLALNCVGGKSATNLVRCLSDDGTLVTYGGMSRKPITIPTGSLIFKNVNIVGYWNSRWLKNNLKNERHQSMIHELANLVIDGRLRSPTFIEYKITDYKTVLQQAMKPFADRKLMFSM